MQWLAAIWFMSAFYGKRFRIETTRLRHHDYSTDGIYFVTVCTRKKIPYFGETISDKIIQTPIGDIVEKFWLEIPIHFHVARLDKYVIMPDHIHGIIIIDKNRQVEVDTKYGRKNNPLSSVITNETPITNKPLITDETPITSETPRLGVSTDDPNLKIIDSKLNIAGETPNPFWKANSIGSIINQFKRICTITIRKHECNFEWQPRFYDHIIRSDYELNIVRNYISSNKRNWDF